MKIKVHWIVDGIAELEAESQEEAEKWVNEVLTGIVNDNPIFSERLGAKAIQGKAYFPGNSEN
mgnify:FL=1|tara:strand:- start:801 stop:989 length:189 start_codon:yes stop_codon:yes gene_type:complete